MKKYQVGVVCLVLGLALQGCATATNRNLDSKLNQEASVQNRKEFQSEANRTIETAKGLTLEQRQSLESLKATMWTKREALGEQSLKLRAILVKDLISSNYDMDEVNLIKARLSDLEDQRLTLIFDAVSKANEIMGRKSADNGPVFRDLVEPRGGSSHD